MCLYIFTVLEPQIASTSLLHEKLIVLNSYIPWERFQSPETAHDYSLYCSSNCIYHGDRKRGDVNGTLLFK
jgi:hypothetical protein